jgi:DNA-binding transcriptional LysR family regulator
LTYKAYLIVKATTFRQLRTLQTVARLDSISAVAEELHLTQPAVSLQISALGEAAGTPMLIRTGRDIQLTEAGEVMARYANEILSLWNDAGDTLASLRGELSDTLRVGAITTAEYLVPPLLVRFIKGRPQVKLQFRIGNRDEIVRLLSMNEIDVAIMGTQPRELRTSAMTFAKHMMAFVASPSHELMAKNAVELEDILKSNLLVRERGAGTRVTVEALFRKSGIKFGSASELSSNEAIKLLSNSSKRGLGSHFCRSTHVHSKFRQGCSVCFRSQKPRLRNPGMWSI